MGYVAPKIVNDGDKFDKHEKGKPGYEFCQIPNRLLSYVMTAIPGNCGNRLKLMIFLMGCGEGFEIHEKTILKRTGMSQSAYSEARKWLNAVGFITYRPSTTNPTIKVNYAYMWSDIHATELEDYIEEQETQQNEEFPSGSVVIGSEWWSWEKYNEMKKIGLFEDGIHNEKEIVNGLKKYLSRD